MCRPSSMYRLCCTLGVKTDYVCWIALVVPYHNLLVCRKFCRATAFGGHFSKYPPSTSASYYIPCRSQSSVAQWSRQLNATVPAGLTGWWLSLAWVQIEIWKEVFQLDWTSGHAMRLNSRTGIEGPPVSSLNCDQPLHSGLKAPELVMDAGCRDNRWSARSAWSVLVHVTTSL